MSYAKVEVMVDDGIYRGSETKSKDWKPHTFLRITHPDGTHSGVGFAPEKTGLTGKGKVFDDTNHEFQHSSKPIALNKAQYDALMNNIGRII